MRENLQGDARQEFYRTVLEIVAKHGGVAQVVISDTSRGTARHADHQFDVLLLSLERFHLELPADETGIVVVARPSGGRADEDTFLSGCADLVAEGSDYLKFNRLVMNIVTMPMQNSRILQAADLVVSITTAMVAGHQQFSEPLFPAVKAVLRNADGRYGGIGVKLHPDFVYVNLYHWLLGDTYYRRGSTGIELPMTNRPFRESADVF